jgi:hypothetical protein
MAATYYTNLMIFQAFGTNNVFVKASISGVALCTLKHSTKGALRRYAPVIEEVNGRLNAGSPTPKGTDRAYFKILEGVRKDLGGKIDFANQGHREAIGNALIRHIRQTGGCDVTGNKVKGCEE